MKPFIKSLIGTVLIMSASFTSLTAQPVNLHKLPNSTPEQIPTYSVMDATTIRNEKTGMMYTLSHYEQRIDIPFSEGRRWLADLAFAPIKNSDPAYPIFIPMGCTQRHAMLMICSDIVMPKYKGDSITRTGITSGHIQESFNRLSTLASR